VSPQLTIVECSDSFSELWPQLAQRLGVGLETVREPSEATHIRGGCVLLACAGVESGAIEQLHRAHRAGIDAPIVVGAEPDHRLAVQLMRRGASSYFALPGDLPRLEQELLERIAPLQKEPEEGDSSPAAGVEFDFSAIIGDHDSIRGALDRAAKVIPGGRATVLILGETGTGKELFAQAIHANGPRAAEPFVAVNCSAIPGTLLESELFGHEKGAFTDARTSKPGLLEVADRGTVFLDEISAMPLELQGKLLRFLETREVRRVGGLRTTQVDVRILAAANRDLRRLIEAGEFREDLYYRLAVIPIELPPLRERGSDLLLLSRHFLSTLAASYGLEEPELTRDALATIEQHPWPGNVRELRNGIERALLLCESGAIRPEHLALAETSSLVVRRPGLSGDPGGDSPLPFPATLDELERAAARAMVDRFGGNKSEAARRLGITRSRLYRILRRDEPVGPDG
jgi:DNA-binding NtrC family response regulator